MGMVHKECGEKRRRASFTLEYIQYCTLVFVYGQYDDLPPHLKICEPNPYHSKHEYVPIMWAFKNGINCDKCQKPICGAYRFPPFYKEFFHKENKIFLRKLRNVLTNPASVRRKPCYICDLLKKYPLLEQHPPNPFPITVCTANKRRRHFKDYYVDENDIVRKIQKRQLPLRKCKEGRTIGFYKKM